MVPERIKKYAEALYGITEYDWRMLSARIAHAFEKKHRAAMKELKLENESELEVD